MAKNFSSRPKQWPKNLNYPDRPIHHSEVAIDVYKDLAHPAYTDGTTIA